MAEIEGEILRDDEQPEAATNIPQTIPDGAPAMQVFNPLDADPVTFKRQLESRRENYDALAMHLRGLLTPDKDFGKIHVMPNCDNKWNCQNPGHFSGYTLFAAGADKILNNLGLGVNYPELLDYKRAPLRGIKVEDVILNCEIIDHHGKVIAEGAGACSRGEMKGDLNRTIKRACKRARMDAVSRLPVISALFEDDFLADVKREADRNGGNTTANRQRQPKTGQFNTGAILAVMPIGKKMKGLRFDEMDESQLDWILHNLQDKPDIWNAAKRAMDALQANPIPAESGGPAATTSATMPPKSGDAPKQDGADPAPSEPLTHDNADWLKEYEDEAEWADRN